MEITEQQSRKRRKRSHKLQNKPSIDRLSSLPGSVICHILSFLSTKHSVRSSILARRWRYLWTYVPNLVFVNREGQEIINRVMLLRKVQSINNFRLFYVIKCSAYQLETWVTFAIVRNVQKLNLCFRSQNALPRCLFTCKTLVDLRLRSCGVIPMSGAVCLPRLVTLHLFEVECESDESLPHLLSGCRVLENLVVESEMDMVYCNVFSPTLKWLIIDYFSEHIKSGLLTSLTEARIELHSDEKKKDEFLHSRTVLEFVGRLCNAKLLTLDLVYETRIIDLVLSAWTLHFRNLTDLELKADYHVLSKILENADNLEILIFTKCSHDSEGWTEPPQQVPKCLLSHLRTIRLSYIGGEKYELEIIRYLLRNAKVLERMEIVDADLCGNEKINMIQEISLFQRGSTTCQVAFVSDL
ncbi:hypothetical protein ACP275_13G058500 [Erythranthe tilingii]